MIGTKLFKCQWLGCGMTFTNGRSCLEHTKTYHIKTGMIGCLWGNCNVKSTSRTNLISHVRTHLPIVSATCYICDKKFKWSGDYRKHARRHNNNEQQFNDAASILFI